MDEQTKTVLKGYLRLNPSQRKELADVIDKQSRGYLEESRVIKDNQISMGPVGQGCPCCGR
ncbi:hypothetical protein M2197_006436 [Bradyrhizobium japonicum]|nr:hypothetical protein [Bradyrhizobium japonicum]MCS3992813.1 hypothetical protein [Bradyrhizobium japonicum]MCS4021255.1 hypothetical protein [Bradyrhizobium japonicum]MCS4208364.1 hypothetical protein [Bradyrhizobium japonicum]